MFNYVTSFIRKNLFGMAADEIPSMSSDSQLLLNGQPTPHETGASMQESYPQMIAPKDAQGTETVNLDTGQQPTQEDLFGDGDESNSTIEESATNSVSNSNADPDLYLGTVNETPVKRKGRQRLKETSDTERQETPKRTRKSRKPAHDELGELCGFFDNDIEITVSPPKASYSAILFNRVINKGVKTGANSGSGSTLGERNNKRSLVKSSDSARKLFKFDKSLDHIGHLDSASDANINIDDILLDSIIHRTPPPKTRRVSKTHKRHSSVTSTSSTASSTTTTSSTFPRPFETPPQTPTRSGNQQITTNGHEQSPGQLTIKTETTETINNCHDDTSQESASPELLSPSGWTSSQTSSQNSVLIPDTISNGSSTPFTSSQASQSSQATRTPSSSSFSSQHKRSKIVLPKNPDFSCCLSEDLDS